MFKVGDTVVISPYIYTGLVIASAYVTQEMADLSRCAGVVKRITPLMYSPGVGYNLDIDNGNNIWIDAFLEAPPPTPASWTPSPSAMKQAHNFSIGDKVRYTGYEYAHGIGGVAVGHQFTVVQANFSNNSLTLEDYRPGAWLWPGNYNFVGLEWDNPPTAPSATTTVSGVLSLYDAYQILYSYAPTTTNKCTHQWKKYFGLNEKYQYCDAPNCKEKRDYDAN